MAKKMTGVEVKIAQIKDNLDRIEAGKYHDLSILACCDYISWLAKFHKAPREVWEPLCDKVTYLLQAGF